MLHFVAYWIVALTLTWLPAYMNKGLGSEPARAGLLFAMFVFITVPISFGVSWYSERRLKAGASSRSARAVTGCIALLICGVMMAAPQFLALGPIQKVVMFTIAAGLSISIFTLAPAMIAEVTPMSQRGAMLAIENAVFGSAAGVLAPVVMGKLIESSGASPMLGYEQGFAQQCPDHRRRHHRALDPQPGPLQGAHRSGHRKRAHRAGASRLKRCMPSPQGLCAARARSLRLMAR